MINTLSAIISKSTYKIKRTSFIIANCIDFGERERRREEERGEREKNPGKLKTFENVVSVLIIFAWIINYNFILDLNMCIFSDTPDDHWLCCLWRSFQCRWKSIAQTTERCDKFFVPLKQKLHINNAIQIYAASIKQQICLHSKQWRLMVRIHSCFMSTDWISFE